MINSSKQIRGIERLLLTVLLFVFSMQVFAQRIIAVRGNVTDETGEAVIGASVSIKGTAHGAITDLNGDFYISNVAEGSEVEVSYVGFITQSKKVVGDQRLVFVLKQGVGLLGEVVVVGYGVQKKSVVTASIAKVSANDLATTSPVRMDNALKGLASGVTVTSSSGQPGAAARIRVRGIGTINNSDPLYIVDGMPIEGGLDYLNPNDIQSIEVLKDAASGAVYGARAANGVILVTTKTGKTGRTKVVYDFSYGWQNAWRKRDVLNASEYALMINEGYINAGLAPKYNDPYSHGAGTDWQKEVFNDNAPVMNHQVSVSGGGEKIGFLFSAGYYTQDGIVGGNFRRSNYERLTLRSNTVYTIMDESENRNWLNNLKITSNLSYARIKATGIETNSTWGSPLGSALALSPLLTVYEDRKSVV